MVSMKVLFGSQTGSAEEVAERIARDASRRNFGDHVPVIALDSYKREDLIQEKLVVFVVSTTGDGEPPDNMRQFWRFIMRKGLPSDVLSNLQIVVFGCGDSSYAQYNVMARKLRSRLLQLGATEIADRGFGDDQSSYGLEGDLDTWLPNMWTQVLSHYPLPPGYAIDESPRLFEPRNAEVAAHENDGVQPPGDKESWSSWQTSVSARAPFGTYQDQAWDSVLTCNRRVTADDWDQDVRHLELEFSSELPYAAGDIAVVYPENAIEDTRLAKTLHKLDLPGLDTVLELDLPHVPKKLTMRELLHRYLDILGTPRRRFFEALSFFTPDEDEKEKLEEMCSKEGNDLFHTYCKKERKNYLDVFDDFNTVKPPLRYFVEMIPLLQPREYSISSSPRAHGQRVLHLTVAMLEYVTPWGRHNTGVASRWWASLPVGSHVLCQIKRGTLRIPDDPNAPMILVGPGTGVAPMRALAYERQQPNVHLYFGCRSKVKDDFYHDEWESMVEQGKLGSIRTAYSRDDPKRKVYVQRLLREDGEKIADLLLQQDAVFYISGNAKQMPRDVKDTVQSVLAKALEKEGIASADASEQAAKVIQILQRKNRFKTEAWN